jgi:hypothetical protein
MRRLISSCVFVALVALLATMALFAQTVVTGDLTGTVTDPTGAGIPNSKLTIKSDATGASQAATSGTAGEFRFSLLRPGTYTLTVNASGFTETTQKATVSLGQASNLTIQMGLQTQAQAVNVTEEVALIQVDNANLATTFDNSQIENLPAPGNDMTAYAFTAPGVVVSTGSGYGNFSAFGLPGVSNLFTINGNDYNDPYNNLNNSGASNLTLGNNEIQEAAVVLNGYTGQYGRLAGAQFNYVTKSGTNEFHGNAAFQYNEKVLNANDWFNNANSTDRPFDISRQWFGSFGGPIKKNKLFFFYDNEGIRYVLPSGGPIYIPTTDFASYVLKNLQATNAPAVPIYQNAFNLWANSSGAGRAVTVTRSVDDALGCGDFQGTDGWGVGSKACARQFQSTVNNLNTEWFQAIRVDYNPTNSDRLYFRYNSDRGVQATGTDSINPAFNANSNQPQDSAQMGYTRSIGPTMVNQLLLSGLYYSAIFGPPDFANAIKTFPTTWAFNDGLYNNNNGANAMGGTDNNFPQGRKVRQWQLIDDFSRIQGPHTLKAGINAKKNFISTYATLVNTTGLVTFNSMTSFVNGALSPDAGDTFVQNFTNVGAQLETLYSLGFYIQDEWKARRNLMLTLTMRLDRNSNIHCYANCFNELLVPFGQLTHDVNTPYNQAIHTGLANAFPSVEAIVPEPRIGVAYNVTPHTVLRGGFGIFSDLYQGLLGDRFLSNTPAVTAYSTSSGLVALNDPGSIFAITANSNAAFQKGFANGATLAQLQASVPGFSKPSLDTVEHQLSNPKFYEWNFEVQQGFGNNYVLSVNYVGNHGYDLDNQTLWLNAYIKTGFTLPGVPAAAPDPRFGEIREFSNNGRSNYDGLVTAFKWRAGSQFSGQFSYTWSHALDTCSNECLARFNLGTATSVRHQLSPLGLNNVNYSSADYDSRHTISANYVYTVPTSYFHNSVVKAVLGGWTAGGTFLYHAGYPFSIINSSFRSRQLSNVTGLQTQLTLADWIGGPGLPSCSTPDAACYTTSQFATTSGQHDVGNVPRNSFRGPGYFDADLNVRKAFSYRERYKLTVGAYFFNVLNHPNFDLPVNNLALGNFGNIIQTVSAPTSAYGAFQGSAVSGRVIQTLVKFQF